MTALVAGGYNLGNRTIINMTSAGIGDLHGQHCSPHFAFGLRVHGRVGRAIEVLGKVVRIRHHTNQPILVGGVRVGHRTQPQHLGRHLFALANAVADPKQLLGGVVECGQNWLGQAEAIGPAVGAIGETNAAIVGNVLVLRLQAVHIQADLFERKVVVLSLHARGLLVESLSCFGVPPVVQVPVHIELLAGAVEAVRYLVSYHLTDGAVV